MHAEFGSRLALIALLVLQDREQKGSLELMEGLFKPKTGAVHLLDDILELGLHIYSFFMRKEGRASTVLSIRPEVSPVADCPVGLPPDSRRGCATYRSRNEEP